MAEPSIPDRSKSHPRTVELLRKLFSHRIVFLGTPIDDEVAFHTVANLQLLAGDGSGLPLRIYVNSPGGSVIAGWRIVSAMSGLESPVHTCCIGKASGGAVHIVAQGARGARTAVREASLELIAPWGGGPSADDERLRATNELVGHLSIITGKQPAVVQQDMEAGLVLSSLDAINYGIIDFVVDKSQLEY